MQESVDVVCEQCAIRKSFLFDITELMEEESSGYLEALVKAWPPSLDGPYIIRWRECQRQMEALARDVDAGVVDPDEAELRIAEIRNSTHPLIAGRYRVFGHRKGSMATAYLCIDEEKGRPVVCKALDARIADATSVLALRQEAGIWLRRGPHPNAVQLLEVLAKSPQQLVLVMEWVPPGPAGRTTLREWLDADAVTLPLALRFAQHLCSAMIHLQGSVPGFVHGDLKPENLLISIGFLLKVSDFGLARAAGLPGPPLSGRSLGTPLYLAPECWQGQPPDEQSDIYSAGLIMYEMLKGKHPFHHAKDTEQIQNYHLNVVPPPIGYPVPAAVDHLVQRCMAKRPEDRLSSFIELARGLAANGDPEVSDQAEPSAVEWNNKGTALQALGRHSEAVECYIKALALAPDVALGWVNMGVSLAKMGDAPRAEKAYKIALSLDSRLPAAHANYAAFLIRVGRLERGLHHCDQALSADPENLVALINRAAILNSLCRHQEAGETAEQARKLDPNHPHIWTELGTACWKLGRPSKARRCAEKALEADPHFEPAKVLLRLIWGR